MDQSQRKIKSKSAGRVQSVALRLIVEKEREIEAFVPEEYWKVKANFIKDDIDFVAELNKKGTKKVKISNEAEALEIFNALSKSFVVDSVKKTSKKRESKTNSIREIITIITKKSFLFGIFLI